MVLKMKRPIHFKNTLFKKGQLVQLNSADAKFFLEKGYAEKQEEKAEEKAPETKKEGKKNDVTGRFQKKDDDRPDFMKPRKK